MPVRPFMRFHGETLLAFFRDGDHAESSALKQDAFAFGQHLWKFRLIE